MPKQPMIFFDNPINKLCTIDVLCDTGSTNSLISEKCAKLFGLEIDSSWTIQCINANKTKTRTAGFVKFPVSIDGIFLGNIELHVYPTLNVNIILGMDLMCLDSGILKFNCAGRLFRVVFCTDKVEILAERDIFILPGQNHRIETNACNSFVQGVAMPNPVVKTITGEIHFITSENVSFNIWNDSDEPISIQKGYEVAQVLNFSELEEQTNFVVDAGEDIEENNPSSNVEAYKKVVINHELPDSIRSKYLKLLEEYKDVFATSISELGTYTGPEMYKVNLTTNRPQKGRVFPIPKALESDYLRTIQDLLDNGLIRETMDTTHDHGVLGVSKKDKSTRWVHDMRLMNSVMEQDAYPLPNLDQLLMYMRGHEVYSKLDLISFFHQFKISPEQQKYFA